MKLIVGLGNPGREYDKTRHNVGFMVVDTIVSNLGLSFNKEKFDGMLAEVMINQEKIMFLKPQRYINLSGEVIKKYVDFYKINRKSATVKQTEKNLRLYLIPAFGKYKIDKLTTAILQHQINIWATIASKPLNGRQARKKGEKIGRASCRERV